MLPYEVDDALPTSTAKLLWPVKFLKEALGLQNEAQCREWFAKHPDVLKACLDCHRELETKIQEIQDKAKRGLETIVAQETLSKYELQPRAELRAVESTQVSRKRAMEVDEDDNLSFADAVSLLMDSNAQKVFKEILTKAPPIISAIVNQTKPKRVKF